MELAKIEQLLEVYFEGNTTLAEEASLSAYFASEEIAVHLQPYQTLFASLEVARTEVSQRTVNLPTQAANRIGSRWYGIAASLVIAIGIAGYAFLQPSLTTEEQQALMAFNESKEAMLLLSQNFNKGAEDLVLLDQFTKTKNKILK